MLAYQMIYTACGKDKNGAFSLWAKSQNITSEEWRAIESVMLYKKDTNVPDLPSEEELKTKCPKKYAYFVLPSGRKCVAQSTYIGKVYSNSDNRLGNYIIHAYVFEDMGGFRPASIFESSSFKTYLTESEWRADAPEDLPAVNLSEGFGAISENDMKNFVNGNEDVVASILQAVANSLTDEKPIVFNASEKEQMIIYTLINALLPKFVYEKATFVTQYSPSSQMSINQTGIEPFKLKNIFFDSSVSDKNRVFNYQEEWDVGEQYVFNFDSGIYSNVTVGAYIKEVLKDLRVSGLNAVLTKIEQLGLIMQKANCDLDTALTYYYVQNRNFTWFKNSEDFKVAFEGAAAAQLVVKEALIPQLYAEIIKTKRWGYNQTTFQFTKAAFACCDGQVKEEIIDEFYQNMSAYGVNASAEPKAFVAAVKENAPFSWNDFVSSVVSGSKWDSRVNGATSLSMNYLFYDVALTALEKGGLGEETRKKIYNYIYSIFVKPLTSKNLNEIRLYFERSREFSLGAKMEKWLMDNACTNWFRSQLNEGDLDFVLKLIDLLGDDNEKASRLEQVVRANMAVPSFVAAYVRLAKMYTPLFNRLEGATKNNPEFKEFYLKKGAYIFEHDDNITKEKLEQYFETYYKTGRDNGAYFAKVRAYLAGFKKSEKLSECLACYHLFARNNMDNRFADVAKIVVYLEGEIYKIPFETLSATSASNMALLKDINNRMFVIHGVTSGEYEKLETLLLIRGKLGGETRREAIRTNKMYAALKDGDFLPFAQEYIADIFMAYVEEKKKTESEKSLAPLLRNTLSKVIMHPQMQASRVLSALENLETADFNSVMAEFLLYAYNETDVFASELKTFIESYLDRMTPAEVKKFYKKIENELKNRDEQRNAAVLEMIRNFNEEHPSGFASIIKSLFGGGKKAQENMKEKPEKKGNDTDK